MTRLVGSALLLAGIGWILLACASSQAQTGTGSAGPKVTVLLYSGKPNPTFTLAGDQVERLRQLVAAARESPPAESGTVLPSILGYNGIVIESRGAGLPPVVAVYQNRIEVRDEGRAKRFLTDDGTLEGFLLQAAAASRAVNPEELRVIRAGRPGQTPG